MTEFGKVELSRREVDMSLCREKNDFSKQFDIIERKY